MARKLFSSKEKSNEIVGIAYDSQFEHIYTGNVDGFVYAITAKTGELVWSFNGYDNIKLAPVVSKDKFGTVYAASKNDFLYAINASNGELFWEFDAEEEITAIPTISADGKNVYFGNKEGEVFSLATTYDVDPWSRYTGAEARWKFDTKNKVLSL